MYSSRQRYERIENYLKGRMTASEKKTFEEELLKDPQLKEEVQIQKFALEAFQMEYLSNVSSLVKERIQQPPTFYKFKWITGAVILVTAIGILAVLYNHDEKIKSGEIEQSNNQPVEKEKSDISNFISGKEDKFDSNEVKSVGRKDEGRRDEHSSEIRSNTNAISVKKDTAISVKEDTSAIVDRSIGDEKKLPEENVFFKPNVTDCSKATPRPEVRINASAYDKNSGQIFVTFPEKTRWQILLEGLSQNYEYKNLFTELEAGTYKISVKDTNDCIYNIGNFVVDRSPCNYNKDYVFNLTTDQRWIVPVSSSIDYKVSIINKAGIEVFGENVRPGENAFWNGFIKSGAKADLGLYKVIINFSDHKTCIYNVVVAE